VASDNPAVPDRSDEIVLADDAVAVLHQVDQQVEHLRLDINRLGPAAQFAPVGIKCLIGKKKFHLAPQAAGQPRPRAIIDVEIGDVEFPHVAKQRVDASQGGHRSIAHGHHTTLRKRRGNLQKIQDRLEPAFKLVMRSVAKHRVTR
jgi:hypothetical protein